MKSLRVQIIIMTSWFMVEASAGVYPLLYSPVGKNIGQNIAGVA